MAAGLLIMPPASGVPAIFTDLAGLALGLAFVLEARVNAASRAGRAVAAARPEMRG